MRADSEAVSRRATHNCADRDRDERTCNAHTNADAFTNAYKSAPNGNGNEDSHMDEYEYHHTDPNGATTDVSYTDVPGRYGNTRVYHHAERNTDVADDSGGAKHAANKRDHDAIVTRKRRSKLARRAHKHTDAKRDPDHNGNA